MKAWVGQAESMRDDGLILLNPQSIHVALSVSAEIDETEKWLA